MLWSTANQGHRPLLDHLVGWTGVCFLLIKRFPNHILCGWSSPAVLHQDKIWTTPWICAWAIRNKKCGGLCPTGRNSVKHEPNVQWLAAMAAGAGAIKPSCPLAQSRVGCTEGIQGNPFPYHKPSPSLSYSSHVLSFLPWHCSGVTSMCAGPRRIISLHVVWSSLWRRRESCQGTAQWERWVQERQGCSLGQAAVSASSAETRRCSALTAAGWVWQRCGAMPRERQSSQAQQETVPALKSSPHWCSKAKNSTAEPFLMLSEEGEHIFPCCLTRQTTGRKCSALKSLFQSHVLKEQVTSKSHHKITTCHLLVTNVQGKLLGLLPCFSHPNVCMCQLLILFLNRLVQLSLTLPMLLKLNILWGCQPLS